MHSPFCSSTNSIAPPPACGRYPPSDFAPSCPALQLGLSEPVLPCSLPASGVSGERRRPACRRPHRPPACPGRRHRSPSRARARRGWPRTSAGSRRRGPSRRPGRRRRSALPTPPAVSITTCKPGGSRALALGLIADLLQHHLGGVVVAGGQHLGRIAGSGCDCTSAIVAPPAAIPVDALADRDAPIDEHRCAARRPHRAPDPWPTTCGVCHESLASRASIGPASVT